jgi:hypothetical protein
MDYGISTLNFYAYTDYFLLQDAPISDATPDTSKYNRRPSKGAPSDLPARLLFNLSRQAQESLCKGIFPIHPYILQFGEVLEMEGSVLIAIKWQWRVDLHVHRLLLD